MIMMFKTKTIILLIFIEIVTSHLLFSTADHCSYSKSKITRVAFLGTGTPNPDPKHSGNSVAIVVNGTPYLVDFGPGLIRQAAALSAEYGGDIEGLNVINIRRAFLTHLHSDHTTGFPDLILTPWVMGRCEPLVVYGPEGLKKMAEHILEAYAEDIRIRLYGCEQANNQGWRVIANEIEEGIIYKDRNVSVEAFRVEHGNWPVAYGYKFTTPDRTIAISGDTRPCENLVKKCQGVDILIHEVYSHSKLKERERLWQSYHPKYHTSTIELAEIAKKVKPGILILYHQLYWGASDNELIREITKTYDGLVVSAKDLDVY
ncbi:MAG: MBL fold metallo-hydrolase [Candidatus Aminicenantes bacterium]|nr:MBL fold metallo-hydrolase [Candidatus Aminicenantes bacterium]